LGVASTASYAADPNKYLPNSYESSLFSGYFDYDYKIDVPPGIGKLAPKLSISYNSHAARNVIGWVGAGWEIPSVKHDLLLYLNRLQRAA